MGLEIVNYKKNHSICIFMRWLDTSFVSGVISLSMWNLSKSTNLFYSSVYNKYKGLTLKAQLALIGTIVPTFSVKSILRRLKVSVGYNILICS